MDAIYDNFAPMKWFRQNKWISWITQFIKQSSEDMGPTFHLNNMIGIRFYYIPSSELEEESSQRLFEAGEMAQQLRALDSVPEDQGSIASTYTIAYNSCFRGSSAVFWSVRTPHSCSVQHKCRQIFIYIQFLKFKKESCFIVVLWTVGYVPGTRPPTQLALSEIITQKLYSFKYCLAH